MTRHWNTTIARPIAARSSPRYPSEQRLADEGGGQAKDHELGDDVTPACNRRRALGVVVMHHIVGAHANPAAPGMRLSVRRCGISRSRAAAASGAVVVVLTQGAQPDLGGPSLLCDQQLIMEHHFDH